MCLRLVASTLAEEYAVEGKMMFLCFASPGLAHHDGGGHFVLGTPVAVMHFVLLAGGALSVWTAVYT